MKSFFLSAFAIAASAAYAAAEITVITPWGGDTWTAGGHGNITWTSSASDANLKCDIQLMNGNASNSNMVAFVTNPSTPVDCSANKFDIYPLNDFAAGKYWIRIGQSSTNTWAYSGVFNFVGNGTAHPYHLASNGASSASGAPAAATAANASGSASSSVKSTASVSGSSAAQSTEANSGIQLNAQGKTMMAVAGGAVAAALALAL